VEDPVSVNAIRIDDKANVVKPTTDVEAEGMARWRA